MTRGESRLQFRSMPRESKSEAEWNLRQAIFRIALVTWKARARNEVRRVSAPEKPPFLSFRRIQDLNFFSFCSESSSFSGHTAPTLLIFSFWVESTKMSAHWSDPRFLWSLWQLIRVDMSTKKTVTTTKAKTMTMKSGRILAKLGTVDENGEHLNGSTFFLRLPYLPKLKKIKFSKKTFSTPVFSRQDGWFCRVLNLLG